MNIVLDKVLKIDDNLQKSHTPVVPHVNSGHFPKIYLIYLINSVLPPSFYFHLSLYRYPLWSVCLNGP